MRSFHAIEPDHLFVFHTRRDMPPRKGEIGNDVKLRGSRAATVVIVIWGNEMAYGIARCQWCLSFNRKLAREVAIGRAKQVLGASACAVDWLKQGLRPFDTEIKDPKAVFQVARKFAIDLVSRISLRADQEGYSEADADFCLTG